MEEYTIYLKLTNACNLMCLHCYNSAMHNAESMSDEVLRKSKAFIKQFKSDHPNDEVNIQLHGGEPCLYDLDKTIALVEELQDSQCKFSITTNLVYKLSDKHMQLFKLMLPYGDVPYIMTSWDYLIRFGVGQQDIWKENVKTLTSSGIVVQPIVCVTRQLIDNIVPAYLFTYFKNLGVKDINFERITLSGRAVGTNVKPTNTAVDNWLFDAFIEYEKNGFHIPLFGNLKAAAYGKFNGCRARKCMKTVMTINPDGTIASCPNMPLDLIGTVDKIDPNKQHQLCIKEKFARFNTCSTCKFFSCCNGDCCQLSDDETGCPGLKKIMRYITHIQD